MKYYGIAYAGENLLKKSGSVFSHLKIILLFFLLMVCYVGYSQPVNISNTTLNTCNATIYDPGGPNGNYTDPASGTVTVTMTICSNNGGPVYLIINSMDLSGNNTPFGQGADNVIIYNGTGTGGTVLYNVSTGISPAAGYISSSGTCLTISFTTVKENIGSATVGPGFSITATCTKPETCSDGILNNGEIQVDCGGPNCKPCYVFTVCGPEIIQNEGFEIPNPVVCGAVSGGPYGVSNQIPRPWYDQSPVANWIGTQIRIDNNISFPSPDYYANCTNSSTMPVITGSGSIGYYAHFGGGQNGEYVQQLLASPLIAGEEYCVSVKAKSGSIGGGAGPPSDAFGMWFHNRTFASGNGLLEINSDNGGQTFIGAGTTVNAIPQIRQPAGNLIPNTPVTLKFSFCPAGGEKYVVVGNFNPGSSPQDYIFIDDLTVKQACPLTFTSGITASGTPDCLGSCVTLTANASNFSGGCIVTNNVTYQWSTGSTASTISVCPTAPTIYSVQITYSAGCKTLTKTETISFCGASVPVVTATGASVCPGNCATIISNVSGGTSPFKYSWNPGGQSTSSAVVCPTVTTVYSVTVTDAANATAISTATVTVIPGVVPSATSGFICAGDSTVLTASGGNTYIWNTGSTSSSIVVSPTATTSYSVLVAAGSCTAMAVATVTVTTNLTAAISGNNSVCLGNSTTLTASGGTSFLWSNGATSASIVIAPTSSGTYSVTVSSGTCRDSTGYTVTVNPLPVITVSPNVTICSGSGTTLSAAGGTGYVWNTGSTASSITIAPSSTSNYSVQATDAKGCTGTGSVNVTVIPKPNASVTGGALICLGDSATLIASGGGSYLWSTGASAAAITLHPLSPGTAIYSVTVTNASGCSAMATATLTTSPPPAASITGTNVICEGENTSLTAGGGGNYLWNTGSSSSSIVVAPVVTTNYSVMVSIGNCKSAAAFTVTVNPNPVATAASSVVINLGDHTTLAATGGGTYHWVPSSGLNNANIANVIASPEATTEYCVYVTNAGGCTDSACVVVTVEINCIPVALPNAFSPNEDGENDVFRVQGNCIREMKLVIYNRWGQKMYEGTDPKEGWDGSFNNKVANTGVFVYWLEYTLITGTKGHKKGNVSLVR